MGEDHSNKNDKEEREREPSDSLAIVHYLMIELLNDSIKANIFVCCANKTRQTPNLP